MPGDEPFLKLIPGTQEERKARINETVFPQLSGLEYAFIWTEKAAAFRAVVQLASCHSHNGVHHFAVFREGHGVAFSQTGYECLKKAKVVP
jgi:hypothetical protein